MKTSKYFFLFLFSIVLFTACQKEDPIIDDQQRMAPTLPPLESMLMAFPSAEDVDTTNLIGSQPGQAEPRGGNSYKNWVYSALNLVAWNTAITLHSAIPFASFAEAFNHRPEFQGNGVWLWAYDYNFNGSRFKAELTGQYISNTEVQWDMTISKVGGFQNVKWYTGVITTDGKSGSWSLSYNPNNPTPYLQIDYKETNDNGSGLLRYTNIEAGNNDKGDYIEYREDKDPNADYDRAYDVFKAKDNNLLEIQWNEINKNGRVKNPKEFGTSEWQCWDTEFLDTDC